MASKFHRAAIDRQVAPPVIRIALEDDAFARFDRGDRIGTAAEQRLEGRLLELGGIDRVLGQHRHQADDQRQFAVVGTGQVEAHRPRVDSLRLDHLGVVDAEIRPAAVAQQLPGEDHVVGRHRLAVGKARRRIEREADDVARGIGLDAFGEQAVERERLVIAARQQALDHIAADIDGGQPLDDERIEAVEGAEHPLHQLAALGRRRIGIARMAETGPPGRLAMHGDGVARLRRPRRGAGEPAGRQIAPQASACAGMAAIAARRGRRTRARTGGGCDSFPVLRNLSQGCGAGGPAFLAH